MRSVFLGFLLCISSFIKGQEITQRIILIGDAGEINHKQETLIPQAASKIIDGKTSAFFLGDNIYPHGMDLEVANQAVGQEILKAQYEPFRKQNVPVYFIAGNHDWDKSGILGLEKIKAHADFIDKQKDKNLQFLPKAGIPGPVTFKLTEQIIAVLYDSEYWLFPHHNQEIAQGFLTQREKFNLEMDSIVKNNQDKTILIFSHHPMRSYGEHGLSFTLKEHIFPLTFKWKKLYLPIPVLGSAYPLVRSTFLKTAEDLKHPIYKELISDVKKATSTHPNVIFISGHDHGLQYIEEGNFRQIVSGSGSKESKIGKNKNLLYGFDKQGFVVLDCYSDGNLKVTFYKYKDDQVENAFEYEIRKNLLQ